MKKKRKLLKNKDFSIISSTCNGWIILHDLDQPFNSPFVNLYIYPNDFIKLLSDFDSYMERELEFTHDENVCYPVGILKDIKIHFMHYESKELAKQKRDERKKRINNNNLFIIFTDRDGCTYTDLKNFDSLPYKNKIVFTKKDYPEIKSAVYMKGFEDKESVGVLSDYKSIISLKRYLDDFDYISWLNNNYK